MDASETWTTKDGEVVPIVDLTDGHLTNIIKYLRRTAWARWQDGLAELYSAASTLQGEMASYYADQEIWAVENMSTEEFLAYSVDAYEALIEEARRRGLEVAVDLAQEAGR